MSGSEGAWLSSTPADGRTNERSPLLTRARNDNGTQNYSSVSRFVICRVGVYVHGTMKNYPQCFKNAALIVL